MTTAIEQMGFDGVFCCDHFSVLSPIDNSLEVFSALTDLASRVPRLHFGPLVAPFSFRDPVMMARQAMAIDDLSGGRMILGVGAGWNEYEHKTFGYPLGDVTSRLDRFEEGLAVVTSLVRSPEPVSFDGNYYHLDQAQLLPRPPKPTRILVGGSGPKRVMPLVAKYADIWNFFGSLETFIARSKLLDDLLKQAGRKPTDVKRTVLVPVLCNESQEELDDLLGDPDQVQKLGPPSDQLDFIQNQMGGITGSSQAVIERLRQYADAGVDEVMVQWFFMGKLRGIEIIAERVLPAFKQS